MPSDNRMRLLIFSGFLGSGKTTLIIALAKRLAAAGLRTCFIVNEVGEVGIDQQVLSEVSLDVWEITSGCICCQLGSNLVATLHTITAELRPAVIIVEASGLATPSGIVDALAHYRGVPFTQQRLITIVDPTRLHVLLEVITPLIEAQIERADEVVLSKADEARAEEMTFAEATIQRLRPNAAAWKVDAHDERSLQPLLAHLVSGTPN